MNQWRHDAGATMREKVHSWQQSQAEVKLSAFSAASAVQWLLY